MADDDASYPYEWVIWIVLAVFLFLIIIAIIGGYVKNVLPK